MLQGVSTGLARTVPALDAAFPALLRVTQMVLAHSLLHIATAIVAGLVLFRGGVVAARLFAFVAGLFYVGLAVVGWTTGRGLCLGLQPFDHPFHLLLGGLGLAAATCRTRTAPGAHQ